MLINLSNHPHSKWDTPQLQAASKYGDILDLPFPTIPATLDTSELIVMAIEYLKKCDEIASIYQHTVVHIAGEPVFCFLLIQLLLKNGYTCITSTSERVVTENGNKKISTFVFNQFRNFKLL